MHFLINELSFIGQAKTPYEVDKFMGEMFNILREIKPIQSDDPIQTHSTLATKKLSSNLTFMNWLYQKMSSGNPNERTLASVFLQIIRKGPFIDLQLPNSYQCNFKQKDVSSSSLTGAVYLKGILISLQNTSDFGNKNISVKFARNGKNYQDININNLVKVKHARKICPRYRGTPKHNPNLRGTAPSVRGTKMDLSNEEAQKVLDRSVKHGKKYYGCHNGDKFYVFQPDNTFDKDGYPTYHGYPIKEGEIPASVKKLLKKICCSQK